MILWVCPYIQGLVGCRVILPHVKLFPRPVFSCVFQCFKYAVWTVPGPYYSSRWDSISSNYRALVRFLVFEVHKVGTLRVMGYHSPTKKWWERSHHLRLLMTVAHTLTFSCWQRLWGNDSQPFVVQSCMRSELFRVKAASLLLHQSRTSNHTFSNFRQHLLLKPELVCGESPWPSVGYKINRES